jgi:hypothetical protein
MSVEIYKALVRAQAAIKAVEKDASNKFHGYKYASADSMIAEARGALNGAGLAVFAVAWARNDVTYKEPAYKGDAIVLTPEGVPVMVDGVEMRMDVTYRLVHESGGVLDFPAFSVPVLVEKGREIDKAEAGARTYALSYFLRDLLLIPRGDEDAPDARVAPTRQTPQRAPEPQREAPKVTPKGAFHKLTTDFPETSEEATAILNGGGSAEEVIARLRERWMAASAAKKAAEAAASPALGDDEPGLDGE